MNKKATIKVSRCVHIVRSCMLSICSVCTHAIYIQYISRNSAVQLTSVGLVYACPNKVRYIIKLYNYVAV